MKKLKYIICLVICLVLIKVSNASSHREAPLISNDPLADNVDLYAFKSPDNPNTITLVATYVPFQAPQGGPNYYSFGQNIRYEIHVDNDASKPGDEVTYRFTFRIVNEDPTTFFNIRLGKQNQKATYNLERSIDGGKSFQIIVMNGIVPPNFIGDRSISGGAGLNTTYAQLWNSAITTASTGEKVFAGPTDDPFFVDLGGIFDLGDAPRQNGKPRDGLACYNVSALVIQVPIATLLKAGVSTTPTNILDPNHVIGVWASASRPAMTTLSSTTDPTYSGSWVQVSRLGMPLTNEAVIPIGRKDFWNGISPYDEITETTMDEYFYNPELALYMDDAKFGGAVPAFKALRIQKKALGSFDFSNGANGLSALKGSDAVKGTAFEAFGDLLLIPGKPRSVDLWPIFHTGVPNAIPYQLATGKNGNPLAFGKPFINTFLPNGGDMLRLNMAVPVTPRTDPNFSSEGLVQAAVLGLTAAPYNTSSALEFIPNMDGFPNGRRLEDDVTRIELQAVGGVVLAAVGLWYDDYVTGGSPVTKGLLDNLTFTTGVEKNDKAFSTTFPYLAMPHKGTGDCSGTVVINPPAAAKVVSQFFVSSNTQPNGALFSIGADSTITYDLFNVDANDADGIHYDKTNDVLYQLNRSSNVIDLYGSVLANMRKGEQPKLLASSTSNFKNGREIAVSGNKLVVAQDADPANGNMNKFVVYDITPTSIKLDKEYTVGINLWGMIFSGKDLIAVEDNSNRVVIFTNFLDNSAGNITADKSIAVTGLVRTHGIDYDVASDLLVLTDVGSATSATDGAIFIIPSFSQKIGDNVLSANEMTVISGAATLLGNPVDVAYDSNTKNIYTAERLNGGGRVLGFKLSDVGNVTPLYNQLFAGATAISLDNKKDIGTFTSKLDYKTETLSLYPNPTSSMLNIDWSKEVKTGSKITIRIVDISGRLVSQKQADASQTAIDVSSLSNGIYILSINDDRSASAKKFTIVK